jgi:hypothetical protein
MNIYKGCTRKDINAGCIYVDNRGPFICMCVGKLLGTSVYSFVTVFSPFFNLERRNEKAVLEKVKENYSFFNPKVRKVQVEQNTQLNCLAYIGRLMKAEDIAKVFAKLKLMGVEILKVENVYIGDWTKRKKLECVKAEQFSINSFYIREEVAYIRQREKKIDSFWTDEVWLYVGKEGNFYEWYSIKPEIYLSMKEYVEHHASSSKKRYLEMHPSYRGNGGSGIKKHRVYKQYDDMVVIPSDWEVR